MLAMITSWTNTIAMGMILKGRLRVLCRKLMCANKVALVPIDAHDFQDAGAIIDSPLLVRTAH